MGCTWFPMTAKNQLGSLLDRLRWIPRAAAELGADGSGMVRLLVNDDLGL